MYINVERWNGIINKIKDKKEGEKMSTKLTTGEEANHFIEKVREKYLSKTEVFNLQDKTVTENGEVKADENYYGLNKVNVNVLPVMEPITVISSITGTEQIINPPSGVTGFSKVTVNPINLQDKTVVPNENIQEVTADTGYSGLNKVTVNKIETEQKTVKSTTAEQIITPTAGKYIDSITVEAIELENKTVKSTTTEQTIQPTSGKDGISEITVEALKYQEKVVNPSTESQEITPDTGYDALSKVTVNPIDLEDKTITKNGVYTSEIKSGFGEVTVDVKDETDLLYTYRNKNVITAEDLAGFTAISSHMFENDTNLVSIDIPEGVMTIEESAFYGCTNLVHVGLPSTLTKIGLNAFNNCTSLYKINIPNDCTYSTVCFYNTPLREITCKRTSGFTITSEVSSSYTEIVNIAEGVTETRYTVNSASVYQLNLPSTLKTFGDSSLTNNYCISSLTFPDSVISIKNYAIRNCYGLKSISLPSGITTFEPSAITNSNPFLKIIYVRGNSSCTTAATLSALTPSQLNNATVVYLENE